MANKRSKQGKDSYTTKIYSKDGELMYESHTENLKLNGPEIDYVRVQTLYWTNGTVDYNNEKNRYTICSLIENDIKAKKVEKKIEKDIKNNILSFNGYNITTDDKAAIAKLQKEKKLTTTFNDPKDTQIYISHLWSHGKDIYLEIEDSNIINRLTIEEFRNLSLEQFFQVNHACILVNFITREIYTNCATVVGDVLDVNRRSETKPASMLSDFDNKLIEDNDWNAIKKSLYFFDKVTR